MVRKPKYITVADIIAEGKNALGEWLFMKRTRIATLNEVWGETSLDKPLYYVKDNPGIGWRIEK